MLLKPKPTIAQNPLRSKKKEMIRGISTSMKMNIAGVEYEVQEKRNDTRH